MQWNTRLLHPDSIVKTCFFFFDFNFIYRKKRLRYRDRAPDIFLNKLYTSIFSVIQLKHWYLTKRPNPSYQLRPQGFRENRGGKDPGDEFPFYMEKNIGKKHAFFPSFSFFFHTKIVLCRRGGNGFNKGTTVLFKLILSLVSGESFVLNRWNLTRVSRNQKADFR